MFPLTIYDVGACYGINYILPQWFDSMRDQRAYLQNMTKVAVEPLHEEYKTIKESGFYQHVYTLALSDKNGTTDFYLTRAKHCASLYKPDHNVASDIIIAPSTEDFDIVETRKVQTWTIDHLMEQSNTKPDWIKLDTQGAEQAILDGGSNALEHATVVILELNSKDQYKNSPPAHQTIAFMSDRGFSIAACNYKPHCPSENDFVFVKDFQQLNQEKEYWSVLLALSLFSLDMQVKRFLELVDEQGKSKLSTTMQIALKKIECEAAIFSKQKLG